MPPFVSTVRTEVTKSGKKHILKLVMNILLYDMLKLWNSFLRDTIKVNGIYEKLLLYLKNKAIRGDTSRRNIKHDKLFFASHAKLLRA